MTALAIVSTISPFTFNGPLGRTHYRNDQRKWFIKGQPADAVDLDTASCRNDVTLYGMGDQCYRHSDKEAQKLLKTVVHRPRLTIQMPRGLSLICKHLARINRVLRLRDATISYSAKWRTLYRGIIPWLLPDHGEIPVDPIIMNSQFIFGYKPDP